MNIIKQLLLPPLIKRSIRILLWTVGVLVLLWMMVWVYVIVNKKHLISQVNETLTERLRGQITIADLEPSLLSTFPNVSLQLSDVLVRDTLWPIHHHDILKARSIIIRLKFFSLFSGSPEINKIILQDASAYIFSDTLGHSNEYMLKPKQGNSTSNANSSAYVPDVSMRNVRLVMELQDRYKFYDLDIARLTCDMDNGEEKLKMQLKTDMLVHQLTFNSHRGSFLKEKPLEGQFRLLFDRKKQELSFENVKLRIDEHPFVLTGKFGLQGKPPLYYLAIRSQKLDYKKASLLLTPNISSRLDSFKIEKPIDVEAIIDGNRLPNKIPDVTITATVTDNRIDTRIGQFSDASAIAKFTNRLDKDLPNDDNNSGFIFTKFRGKLEGIPLTSDSVAISNLKHPELRCDLHADFELSILNDLMSGNTIDVKSGRCKADVRYQGLVIPGDSAGASVTGKIEFFDAAVTYLPRKLELTKLKGAIVLDDKNVMVKQLSAKTGSSDLLMNGEVKNFTSLIDAQPEKLLLNWNVESTNLNLSDFVSFIGKRYGTPSLKATKRKTLRLFNQIDKMLQDCSVDLSINARKLVYKKFDAANLIAEVRLNETTATLKKVQLRHAGGSLSFSGSLNQLSPANTFTMQGSMDGLDIKKVFTAFNNFSQDGITDKNLEGKFSATTTISGKVTDKADLVSNSLQGRVELLLKEGSIKNYEPLEKISQTAFKNRNFSDIRFADLRETMDINGSQIKLGRMEIQSTVFSMFVEGIYDFDKGTDLSIQIPMSNLAKRDESFELKNKGVNSKAGLSLYLRAKSGDDGKTKISWDPFKKALKKSRSDSTAIAPRKPNAAIKD